MLTNNRKLIILAGNFLEFYEFTLFAALIPIISPLLFPSTETLHSYTSGYLFLLIAFLARPIGAILFGYIGDLYGRKIATMSTILLMSLATIGIGLMPTNNSSILIFLSFLRVIQGLSAGGEYSGAGLLLIENDTKKDSYFNGAILTASGLLGASVATAAAALVSLTNVEKEVWRLLFLIGGLIGLIIFVLRVFLKEEELIQKKDNSWLILVQDFKKPLLLTVIVSGSMNAPWYVITSFVNTYFIANGNYSKINLMFINSLIVLFSAGVTLYFGVVCKKFNAIKLMMLANILMFVLAIPLFFMLEVKSIFGFVTAEIILILLAQLFVAPAFAVVAQLFPKNLRYRGVAIGLSIGGALFGGCAPYICMHLVKYSELRWSPGIFLTVLSFISFLAILEIQKTLKLNMIKIRV